MNGRTLVPVRGIFEQLGATVEWNQGTQTATMTRGGVDVKVTGWTADLSRIDTGRLVATRFSPQPNAVLRIVLNR